jgi:transcription antitermination factor NusG
MVEELFGRLESALPLQKWQVVHTKPQQEKKLAEYLKRRQIVYYLPQLESIRTYQYRKVTFTKPMFPGYLFARFATEEAASILLSGCVVRFIKVPSETELLTELIQIYNGRNARAELKSTQWLESGWEVEIVSGPLQGMLGVVQDQSRLTEVTLQVKILRQAVAVKVNPAQVRLVREVRYT